MHPRGRTRVQEVWPGKYGPAMTSEGFVPVGFEPLSSLVTDRFQLEPLGPQKRGAGSGPAQLSPGRCCVRIGPQG